MAANLNLVYPTPEEIFEINQDLMPTEEANRVGFKLMPRKSRQTINVGWWQKDNDFGLMSFRGLDGVPPKVQRLGYNKFEYEAGVYGEHEEINETEWMKRANLMDITQRIKIGDLVAECDRQLMVREMNRMESNIWTLLATGTLSIPTPGPNGPLVYKDSYTIQTYTSNPPWTSLSTATPIQDMQNIQQLGVGHSGKFDASATMYINQFTANALVNNQNAADLDGRRSMYGATLNNVEAISSYFRAQNLPGIEVYDDGYQLAPQPGPETNPMTPAPAYLPNQFQKYIGNHVGILIGRRPNDEAIGEYQITVNSASGTAASYTFVADQFNGVNAPKTVPGKILVYRITNGGPALTFPYSVLAATF